MCYFSEITTRQGRRSRATSGFDKNPTISTQVNRQRRRATSQSFLNGRRFHAQRQLRLYRRSSFNNQPRIEFSNATFAIKNGALGF
jgi:hypothetical protein